MDLWVSLKLDCNGVVPLTDSESVSEEMKSVSFGTLCGERKLISEMVITSGKRVGVSRIKILSFYFFFSLSEKFAYKAAMRQREKIHLSQRSFLTLER